MSKSDIPSDTFCVLPWMHVNFWPSGDVHHCCMGDWRNPMGNLSEGSPDEIVNNERYKELRLKFLNNEKPASCMRCFEREDYGVQSMRQHHNDYFASSIPEVLANTHEDGFVDNFKFEYWDFRFSNLCNMKCRMCGSGFSSQWFDDEVELFKRYGTAVHASKRVMNAKDKSTVDVESWIDEKIDDVKYCYFAGGEPLIMDEHYYILQRLLDANRTDVKLRYNTNLLKLNFKHFDLIEMWSKFDSVQINPSLDDIGARAEYIRKGTVWNDIEENLVKLLSAKNISIAIECTTQAMNVLTLPEFITRLSELGISPNKIMLHNILQQPQFMSVKVLSDELKQQVEHKLSAFVSTIENEFIRNDLAAKFQKVIKYMNETTDIDVVELQKEFKIKQIKLDTIRNESFVSVFPHLEEWYNEISV